MAEKKFFESEEEFVAYVDLLPIDEVKKREIIKHEVAHLRKAREFGYDGRYYIEEARSNGFSRFRGGVEFSVEIENPEHIQAILSAPEDMSISDKEFLSGDAKI